MKIAEVTDYEEQEDGSALLTLELDQESINYLVSYAINDLLKKELDRHEASLLPEAAEPPCEHDNNHMGAHDE